MITEDYVSFEVAKLLKEKGFDEPCLQMWECGPTERYLFRLQSSCYQNITEEDSCLAPTLQMTCKWLRETHGYYIQVMLDGWALGGHTGYYVLIQKTDSDFELMLADAVDKVFYETHEEAIEAALKYVLENLI